jgi:hypothetical protein
MRLLGRCVLADAALVDGGTHPYGGEIRLRVSPDEPCYGCSLSPHDRGVADLPWSCFGITPEGPQPASIATTALVGSWLSVCALEVILGRTPAYRVLSIDTTAGRTAPVTISRDPGCPHHRPLAGKPDIVPVTTHSTISDFLATLKPDEEPLAWEQFTVGMRCGGCQHGTGEPAPGRDINADQTVSVCGKCGGLMRARFSQRLRDASPHARLSDLGIAPEDILPVWTSGGEYRCLRLSR